MANGEEFIAGSAYETINGLQVSKPKVMQSNAGYYIGRSYLDPDCDMMELPYDRLSSYIRDRQSAEKMLAHYLKCLS